MRVLLAIPSIRSPVGEQFIDLALHLHDKGHAVLLITRTDAAGVIGSRLDGRIEIARWPAGGGLTRPAIFLTRSIRTWKPDCVVSQFGFVNFAVPLAWILRVPRRVAWFRTLVEQSAIDRGGRPIGWRMRLWRRRLVYRLATDVVSVSRIGSRELTHVFGVPQSKCFVVPNGLVDPGMRIYADAPPLFVAVGRLVPSKGHEILFDAFAELRDVDPTAKLVLIGEGPLISDLRRKVETLRLAAAVSFVGKIPHDEVIDHLRRAIALVHPSRIDNCPAVVQEAMALGVPVVATHAGGVTELVEADRSALLTSPEDPRELAQALRRVLTDEALRTRLTAAARRDFEERFERSRFVHRTADFLLSSAPLHAEPG